MGIRLIVEVLDHAPADLTPSERLLLVVIAESARDETREGWPGMDELTRRTGLSPASVSKVLQRLARRVPPIEVRVPMVMGRDGRPVYAREGRRTTYRLPAFRGVQGGPPSTLDTGEGGPPSALRGRTTSRMRADHESHEGGPPSAPSPQVPSETLISLARTHARAADLIAALGATEREVEMTIEKIKTDKEPRKLDAYVETLSRNGDLYEWLKRVRTGETNGAGGTDGERERLRDFRQYVATLATCEHGEPGGHELEATTGWSACVTHRVQRRQKPKTDSRRDA